MRTVLVVDDEETLRLYYSNVLKELGFSVTNAANGMEALKKCSGKSDPFDLAILDWIMPVMGGALTKKHLEEIYPGMPIIVASGSVDPSEVTLNKNQFFLSKPFSRSKLQEVITHILGNT